MNSANKDRPAAAAAGVDQVPDRSPATPPVRAGYHHGDLHAALIDEVERMVMAKQLDQVTMNELCARLGVARSAPYRHFRTKSELLCAVAVRAKERVRVLVRAHLQDRSITFDDRFRSFSRAFFDFSITYPDVYRLLYRENLSKDDQTQDLAAVRQGVFAELMNFLQEGQDLGVIRQGDAATQVMFWWTTFHGMVSFVLDRHFSQEYFRGMQEAIIEALLRGLGTVPE